MKNSRTVAITAGGIALLTAGVAMGAESATAAPERTPDFSLRAPSIIDVAGERLDETATRQHIIYGGDRKPAFTVLAGDPSQVGHCMVVTDLLDHRPLCSAEVGPDLLAACSPTDAFDLGRRPVSATVEETAGGGAVTDRSPRVMLRFAWEDPTIQLDSYDPVTRTARVSGHTVADRIDVNNSTSYGATRLDPATGDWHADVRVVDPVQSINAVVGFDDVLSRGSVWLPEARSPEPSVTSAVNGSTARVHVDGLEHALASVHDSVGRLVAETVLDRTGGDLDFPIPSYEARYTVTQQKNGGPQSEPVVVVFNGGVVGAAPVEAPQSAGTRAVVPVRGVPGGVVTIRSLEGRVVAVKAIGITGSAQVSVPLPAARSSVVAFTAEQTVDRVTSPSSLFGLSSSPSSQKDQS